MVSTAFLCTSMKPPPAVSRVFRVKGFRWTLELLFPNAGGSGGFSFSLMLNHMVNLKHVLHLVKLAGV